MAVEEVSGISHGKSPLHRGESESAKASTLPPSFAGTCLHTHKKKFFCSSAVSSKCDLRRPKVLGRVVRSHRLSSRIRMAVTIAGSAENFITERCSDSANLHLHIYIFYISGWHWERWWLRRQMTSVARFGVGVGSRPKTFGNGNGGQTFRERV